MNTLKGSASDVDLISHYLANFPDTELSREAISEHIDLLKGEAPEGLIFFAINYAGKYYHSEARVNLGWTLMENLDRIRVEYETALVKKAMSERSEEEVEPKNKFEGKDTPGWFGKSIDFNLFK